MRHPSRQQQTLARPVRVHGFGYWSGEDVWVEFRPAACHSGVVFVRADLDPPALVPADVAHRIDAPRRTTLLAEGTAVEMVEHIMAALAGMSVDNCQVWLSRPESPGCDGSSLPFVKAIELVGLLAQEAPCRQLAVSRSHRVGEEDCWVEAHPHPHGGFSLHYQLDYRGHSPIGRQSIQLDLTPASFRRELAPARTFLLKHEAEWLRSRGLGLRVTCRDLLVFDELGPRGNRLRFPDECVRHKALDLVGDLALAGCSLAGHFVAYRSGHRQNAELVRLLLSEEAIVSGWRKTA